MSSGQQSDAKPRYWTVTSLLNRHGELLRRRQFEERTENYLNEVNHFLVDARGAGAFLDGFDDRRSAQNVLNYWSNVLSANGRPESSATLAEFDPAQSEAAPLDDVAFPWDASDRRGLAGLFPHRQELARQMVLRLTTGQRLLALMGPAGSGRSVLLADGIVPLLQSSTGRGWRYLEPLAPGSAPLRRLAEALLPGRATEELLARWLAHPESMLAALKSSGEPILLVVDRFEQLFTQCDCPEVRQAFVSCLASLIETPQPAHRVILMIRTDYLSRAIRLGVLGPRIEESLVRVAPFDARELRQYIEGPAAEVGLHFETGLVDHLLDDFVGDPSAVPLLQLTLRELWNDRQGRWITWKSYNQLGGGRMLERRAEELYRHAEDSGDGDTLRKVLLSLVRIGPHAEVCTEKQTLEALYTRGGGSRDSVDRVLEELKSARLVDVQESDDGQLVFGLKHDAPATHWPRLAHWLEEARFQSVQRDRLTSAAAQWQESDRAPEGLWRGSLLKECESYSDLSALEQDFVQAGQAAECQAEQEKFRSKNRKIMALATGLAVVLLLAVTAMVQRNRARHEAERANFEARRANRALTESLSVIGMRAIEQGDPFDALPYFSQALNKYDATDPIPGPRMERSSGASDTGARRGVTHQRDVYRVRFDATLWQLPTLGRLLEHDIQCRQCDLSPNGWMLVAATGPRGVTPSSPAEDRVVLWDLQAPKRVGDLLHPQRVNAAYFLPDGRHVATGSEDGQLRVWDVASRTVLWAEQLKDAVRHLAISRDGSAIAAAAGEEVSVWRTNAAAGEPRLICSQQVGGRVVFVAFASRGKQVAAASQNQATVLDSATGEIVHVFQHQPMVDASGGSNDIDRTTVSHVLFAAEDRYLLTAGATATSSQIVAGKVLAWDILAGTRVGESVSYAGSVSMLALSPSQQRIAAACSDGAARIWDLSSLIHTSLELRRLDSRPAGSGATEQAEPQWVANSGSNVTSVAFSPDGRFLLATSRDKTARVWDVTRDAIEPVTPPLKHPGYVAWGAFTSSGQFVVTASDDPIHKQHSEVRVWAPEPKQPADQVLADSKDVVSGWLGHGDTAATTDGSGRLAVWNTRTGKPTEPLPQTHAVTFAQFHPTQSWLATADESGDVLLWDLKQDAKSDGKADARRLMELHHGTSATHVSFNEDGSLLATAGDKEGLVLVWHYDSEQQRYVRLHTLQHAHPVRLAVFGRGKRPPLVTACVDQASNNRGTVQIWNLRDPESGSRRLSPSGGSGNESPDGQRLDNGILLDATFNPDGTRLLTGSTDDTAVIWNVADGRLLTTFKHTADVQDVEFSADGTRCVTASVDQTARVWDVRTGRPVQEPLVHQQAVQRARFSPNGRLVVTTTSRGSTRVWDTASGIPVTASSRQTGPVFDLRFAADGGSMERLHGGPRAHVSRWRLTLDRALAPADDEGFVRLFAANPSVADDPQNAEQLSTAWNDLSARYPELLAIDLTADVPVDWHTSQVDDCEVQGQWAAARWHLDRLISLGPTDGQADAADARLLARRANVHRQLMEWHAAVNDLSRAIAIRPSDARLRYLRGRTYGDLQVWDKVIDDLEEALRLGQPSEYAWYRLALVYLHQEKREEYEKTCQKMLAKYCETTESSPANLTAWTWALGHTGPTDTGEWLPLAQRAVSNSHGNRHYYLHTLAAVQYRAGDYPAAAGTLREAMAARPSDQSQTPWDLVLHAAIQARQESGASAAATLRKAKERTTELQAAGRLTWDNQLELEILQKEVSSIVTEEK